MEIKIRELNVDDIFTVARMLGKITKGARLDLAQALTTKKPNMTELGMALFQSVFTEAEEDLKAWLADIIGEDKAAFGKMPGSVVLDIVEQLIDQGGIRDFFGRALSMVDKMGS